jgi:hypothetical protein
MPRVAARWPRGYRRLLGSLAYRRQRLFCSVRLVKIRWEGYQGFSRNIVSGQLLLTARLKAAKGFVSRV